MKLIVGLGNPGRKYVGTRHNVGFVVVEELARRHALGRVRSQFEGEAVEANVRGQRCLLLCPHTFMNRSGRSVVQARDFFKLASDDVLIICDDFNLQLAKIRCRRKGSAGGQRGLEDVIRCLGTQDLPRLRIGIGQPPPQWDVADYVLSRFPKEEHEQVAQALGRAATAAEDWVEQGIDYCMNQYNAG